MSWRTQNVFVLVAVALFLGLAGCSSSSDDDDDGGGASSTQKNAVNVGDSVSDGVSNLLGAESGSESALNSGTSIFNRLGKSLARVPGVRPPAKGINQVSESGEDTVILSGDSVSCDATGSIEGSGSFVWVYDIDTDNAPSYYDEGFATSSPLELTFNDCSNGDWTVTGDIAYAVEYGVYLESEDDFANTVFGYSYADAFEADVTASEDASGDESAMVMSFAFEATIAGTVDEFDNVEYATFDLSFDITLNGDSFSCTWSDPSEDPDCT